MSDIVQERLLALYALVWEADTAAAAELIDEMAPGVAHQVLKLWAINAAIGAADDPQHESQAQASREALLTYLGGDP